MITTSHAKAILNRAKPLVLNDGLGQPITPNHVSVSEDALRDMGIPEGYLDDHISTFYDGKDYDSGHQPVHVFVKDKLERYAGIGWAEQEHQRKEAQAAMECGG